MKNEFMAGDGVLQQEVIQWACKCLKALGYRLKSKMPENVLNTPWSYLLCFETSAGYIYLKHTPKLFALEATIIQILHEQFYAAVPAVVAHNVELNCFFNARCRAVIT